LYQWYHIADIYAVPMHAACMSYTNSCAGTFSDIVRLAASLCRFQQCPLEMGSVRAERVGQGGGGWVGAPTGCKQHGHVWARL